MNIENLKLELNASDIQGVLDSKLHADRNLSDVKVSIENGAVVLSAKYQVPIMGTVNLNVNLVPKLEDSRTVSIDMNFMNLGGMIIGMIMKFIDSKISEFAFISRDGNTLTVAVDKLLEFYDIKGAADIKKFAVVGSSLVLDAGGDVSLF